MNITQTRNRIAICTAIASFSIGIVLFIVQANRWNSYLGISYWNFMELGLYYISIAALLNSLLLIFLIIRSIATPEYYKENITTLGIVLLNIPIVLWLLNFI